MLLLTLSQAIPDFLSLIRRHVVKTITQLLTSVRAQLTEAPEVRADTILVPCRQILKLLVAITNGAALIITETSPGLESILCRSTIF